jgi:hypothetical protein
MKDTIDSPQPSPSPSEIDDLTKMVVETLYKEFQRIQVKSVATDDWFFRFLSIAVIPFLGFLGYAAITPPFRILVAALPVLSLVGLLVVCVLSSHYVYAGTYGTYLQLEINRRLRSAVMRDTIFGAAAYDQFTPVRVSYSIGVGLLVVVNLLAAPFITHVVHDFYATHRQALGPADFVLQNYWTLTLALLAVTLVPALASLLATHRRLRALLRTETAKNCTHSQGEVSLPLRH